MTTLLGSRQLRTTAYNPRANGAVERMHRRLKDALKCRRGDWLAVLPAVLLGMRSAPRDDTGFSCAEMTYGTALRLPGEVFENAAKIEDSFTYVKQLRQAFRVIRPAPFHQKKNHKIFVHPDLKSCKYVYVRVDCVKEPLEAPYAGPYLVVKCMSKWYIVDINGKHDSINIDRLKPVYILADDESVTEGEGDMECKVTTGNEIDSSKLDIETRRNTRLNRRSIYVGRRTPAQVIDPPPLVIDPASVPLPPSPVAENSHQEGILVGDNRTRSGRIVKRPVRFIDNPR